MILVMTVSGCSYFTEEEVPTNDLIGDYTYSSLSTYFDSYGEVKNELKSTGGLSFTNKFTIVPRTGWSYNIEYTNLNEHILSTGDRVFTFDIPNQSISLNGEEFLVIGVGLYDVNDPDGSIIGTFDGWVDVNSTIYFSYESVNTSTFTKTRTSFQALKR